MWKICNPGEQVPDEKVEHGDWVMRFMLTFRFCASNRVQNKKKYTEQFVHIFENESIKSIPMNSYFVYKERNIFGDPVNMGRNWASIVSIPVKFGTQSVITQC